MSGGERFASTGYHSLERHKVTRGVFPPLHLAIDDAGVFTLPINVVYLQDCIRQHSISQRRTAHLSHESSLSKSRVENMIDINGKKLQKALLPSSGHSICGMVGIGPCICAIRKSAVRKVVDNSLVRILL